MRRCLSGRFLVHCWDSYFPFDQILLSSKVQFLFVIQPSIFNTCNSFRAVFHWVSEIITVFAQSCLSSGFQKLVKHVITNQEQDRNQVWLDVRAFSRVWHGSHVLFSFCALIGPLCAWRLLWLGTWILRFWEGFTTTIRKPKALH